MPAGFGDSKLAQRIHQERSQAHPCARRILHPGAQHRVTAWGQALKDGGQSFHC